MKKLLKLGSLLLLANFGFAGGNSNNLTVSSGTYQPVSAYSNDDGGIRQAITIGDASSSDTVRVDRVTGVRVSLSTSALTTTNGVKIEPGQSAIPVVSTGSIAVTQSGLFTVANSTIAVNVLGSVSTTQGTTPWIIGNSTSAVNVLGTVPTTVANSTMAVNVLGTVPISGTVSATQGTTPWIVGNSTIGFVQVGIQTIANSTTAVNVLGTVPTTVANSTMAVTFVAPQAVTQSGTWNIGTVTNPVTVTPGAQNLVITATATIPVSGSFSATLNDPTTGTINSPVPLATQLVGGQGLGGNAAHFRVDASSYLYVNVAAGGAAGGTSSNFATVYPAAGTAAGFVNQITGGMQAAAVNTSSHVVVTPGSVAFPIVSTNTLTVANSTMGVTQVGLWSISNSSTAVTFVSPQAVTQSGTWNVGTLTSITNPVTVTPGANSLVVSSTGAFTMANSTIGVTQVGIQTIANSTIAVVGLGNFTVANSSISVVNLMLVSSNTVLPAASADTTQVKAMVDAYGRSVTICGVPTSVLQSTRATITNTSTVVMVSSPTATTFTHMIGCMLTNTSATNTYATLFMRGDLNSTGSKLIPAPANYVPTGYSPDACTPFLNTRGGEQVAVQANASVSSLIVDCSYYQSTTP